ncbi:MAG: glycosyl transferase family 2, partial [Candidatus Cryptobacteroides sp.]
CLKTDFLKIHFEDELWMDSTNYALGEDQVMYYKMHLLGLKVFTLYDSGIIHLDAGGNLNPEKQMCLLYSDLRFKVVFWHRFLWTVDNACGKLLDSIAITYYLFFTICISVLKLQRDALSVKCKAIKDSLRFLESHEYKRIPKVKRV